MKTRLEKPASWGLIGLITVGLVGEGLLPGAQVMPIEYVPSGSLGGFNCERQNTVCPDECDFAGDYEGLGTGCSNCGGGGARCRFELRYGEDEE